MPLSAEQPNKIRDIKKKNYIGSLFLPLHGLINFNFFFGGFLTDGGWRTRIGIRFLSCFMTSSVLHSSYRRKENRIEQVFILFGGHRALIDVSSIAQTV